MAQTAATMTSVRTRVGVIQVPPGGDGLPPRGNGPSDGDGSPWRSGRCLQHGVVQPLYVGRADLGQQIRYLAPARDLRVRVDVVPRGEDEGAFIRTGMRQGQLRVVAHDVTVDDDVQVEGAGPPGLFPDPPEDGLDPVTALQDGMRGQRRGRYEHGVQIVGLLRAAHRGGPVNGRHRDQGKTWRVEERVEASLQILQPLAEVAAHSDRDPGSPGPG